MIGSQRAMITYIKPNLVALAIILSEIYLFVRTDRQFGQSYDSLLPNYLQSFVVLETMGSSKHESC